MSLITSLLLDRLQFASWPLSLRKPLTLWLIKRKKHQSLPFKTTLGGLQFEGDAVNLIDYHVLSRGAFEPGLTALLAWWAEQFPGGMFLDVGANVGVHSLVASKAYRKVLAVEPFPPLIERLLHHIRINNIPNIELIKGGLGSATREVSFRAPSPRNLGTGRVTEDDNEDSTKVQLYHGDEIISKQELPLSAVKIDVEGFEIDVLSGLKGSLEKHRPLIICELLTDTTEHIKAFTSAIPENYEFFTLENIQRKKFRLSPWNKCAGDVVACPVECKQALAG